MSDNDGKIRGHLKQATATLLETMEGYAASGRLDKVEEISGKIAELARLRNFPAELRETIGASSEISLQAYRQKIGDLIELAAALASGADAQVRTAILDLIDGILAKARTVGASAEFADDIQKRITRYRPQAPALNAPFEDGPVFGATKVSLEAFAAETTPDEDWRVRRYNKPPLTVMALGEHSQTRNWTERGFVLTGFAGSVSPGARLHVGLRCEAAPDFDVKCWVRVVHCDPTGRMVAAEFEKDSPIGPLMEQITAAALGL